MPFHPPGKQKRKKKKKKERKKEHSTHIPNNRPPSHLFEVPCPDRNRDGKRLPNGYKYVYCKV